VAGPTSSPPACPSPARPEPHDVRKGHDYDRQGHHRRGRGGRFGATPGTLLYRSHLPSEVIARALLVVLPRGSLRAAGAVTGHA
jgi:hypothetical protein